jgi:hypothetical protein
MNLIFRPVSAIAAISFAACLMLAPSTAAAEAAQDPAWEKFTSARRVFQIRLCELASRRWPEYASFFAAHRDLQLAYIERRGMVFYHLLAVEPSRVVRDQGGEKFLNFSWTEKEEKKFFGEIAGYAALSAEIANLKSVNAKFKKRDLLRDRFSRLEIDPEYLGLMREMSRSIAEAERALALSLPASSPAAAAPQAPAPVS